MQEPFKFEMGDKVREKITGYTGLITGQHRWITGCDQFTISPEGLDKNGVPIQSHVIDEGRLEIVPTKKPKPEVKARKNGCDQIAPTKF